MLVQGIIMGGLGYGIYINNLAYYEYIGNTLKNLIIKDEVYEVFLYVSLADNSTNYSNNIGVVFLNSIYNSLTNPMGIQGQADVKVDTMIGDTTNWVLIRGAFSIDINSSYLVIGNHYLYNDIEFNTPPTSFGWPPYYYIDDVCVVPLGGDCSIAAGRMRIESSEQQLLFAATPVGQQEYQSFWLRNPGLDTLHVSGFSTQNPVFIAPTGQYSVPPGDSVLLSVGFAPTAVQNYQDSLYITHDAPRSRYKVALEGEGLPVGVRGYAKAAFSVFPNPARGLAYLVSKDASEIVQVKLYNQLGQAILLQQTQSVQVELDLAGLAPGLYLVELVLADGRRGISKLLVINY